MSFPSLPTGSVLTSLAWHSFFPLNQSLSLPLVSRLRLDLSQHLSSSCRSSSSSISKPAWALLQLTVCCSQLQWSAAPREPNCQGPRSPRPPGEGAPFSNAGHANHPGVQNCKTLRPQLLKHLVAVRRTAATTCREAAVPEQHTHLILLGQSPILSVANADDNISCAEAKVRVVSDVVDAHILLFSNELRQKPG